MFVDIQEMLWPLWSKECWLAETKPYISTKSIVPTLKLPPALLLSFCHPCQASEISPTTHNFHKKTSLLSPGNEILENPTPDPIPRSMLRYSHIRYAIYMVPSIRRFSQYVPCGHSYSAILDSCISMLKEV